MLTTFALAAMLSAAQLKDLVVTEQPNRPLFMKVGQRLVFVVTGNASTGANWTIKNPGKPGLEPLGIKQVPSQVSKPPLPGQGSDYRISFKAVKTGSYSVMMVYGRSWELAKNAKPWDQRIAKVVIQ